MESLGTVSPPYPCGRVRRSSPARTDDPQFAESLRLLSPQGAATFRARPTQRRPALAGGLYPTPGAEGMDFRFAESVSVSAFCPVYLPPRGRDHRRFFPNLFRVRSVSRQTVFRPG